MVRYNRELSEKRVLLSVGFCAFAPFLIFRYCFLRTLGCGFLVCYFGFLKRPSAISLTVDKNSTPDLCIASSLLAVLSRLLLRHPEPLPEADPLSYGSEPFECLRYLSFGKSVKSRSKCQMMFAYQSSIQRQGQSPKTLRVFPLAAALCRACIIHGRGAVVQLNLVEPRHPFHQFEFLSQPIEVPLRYINALKCHRSWWDSDLSNELVLMM